MQRYSLMVLIIVSILYAHQESSASYNDSLFRAILKEDITTTPLLPAKYRTLRRNTLPVRVDNSQSRHFRTVFNQSGGSCTIASTIGYTFTYLYNTEHDLDGMDEENQYPTHFIWNFCNGGGLTSVGRAVELLRKMGTVNIPTWGEGIGSDEKIWKSGYTIYLEAMRRKASARYYFPIETIDDIELAKSWLYSMNGWTPYGGLLGFGNNFVNYTEKEMTSGSQAGKTIITKFGNSGGHYMTIVGYDDSACYDFNGDGKFTNDVDINDDGKVTLADREWGCFKVVNSWGPAKHDNGFFYFPYRHYALPTDSGGLDNSIDRNVSVLMPVDADQKVLGAFEIKFSCKNRQSMKIHRGIASGTAATKPIHTNVIDLGFKAKSVPMTGTDSTIVMGFDATELLSIDTYQYEDSLVLFWGVSSDSSTGTVHEVVYHDYRNGGEKVFKAESLPVVFDSTLEYVRIPVLVNNNSEELQIITDSVIGKEGEQHILTVDASGGEGEYVYTFDSLLYDRGKPIHEKPIAFDFCYNNYKLGQSVPSQWSGVAIELPFDVLYYGKLYDTVTASAYGKFYFRDPLMKSAGSAFRFFPLVAEDLAYYPALNLSGPSFIVEDSSKNKNDPKIQGFYYKVNDSSIDFKYGGIYFNAPLGEGYEQFTTRIHSNGRIDTYIESNFSITDSSLDKEIVMGISDGYGHAQQYPIYTCREFRDSVVGDGFSYSYIPSSMPEVCILSPDGTLTLKSDTAGHWRVPVAVTDSRGVTVKKCIQFIVGETGVVTESTNLQSASIALVGGKLQLQNFKHGDAQLKLYSLQGRLLHLEKLRVTSQKMLVDLTHKSAAGVSVVEVLQGGKSVVQKVIHP